MSTEKPSPKTLIEAVNLFSDEEVAFEYVRDMRWPDGPVCPKCKGEELSFLKSRKIWKCKACKNQFSLKKGTIFEGSALP